MACDDGGMATALHKLETLSFIAAHIQRPYSAVRRATEELGLQPALRINRTDHYSVEQAERIAAHLKSTSIVSVPAAETGPVPTQLPPPAA